VFYKELAPMRKEEVDPANKTIFISDSKTPSVVAEVPLTDIAVEAFRSQIEERRTRSLDIFLIPLNPAGYQTNFRKPWETTLRKSDIPYFDCMTSAQLMPRG
jgi:integrase